MKISKINPEKSELLRQIWEFLKDKPETTIEDRANIHSGRCWDKTFLDSEVDLNLASGKKYKIRIRRNVRIKKRPSSTGEIGDTFYDILFPKMPILTLRYMVEFYPKYNNQPLKEHGGMK